MIKASTLNFVRDKAQEGEDWAKLHTQLKLLSTMDLPGEQKKLQELQAKQLQANEQLKAAYAEAEHTKDASDKMHDEAWHTKVDAEKILADADARARQIVAAANLAAAKVHQDADKFLADKEEEFAGAEKKIKDKAKDYAQLVEDHASLARAHQELATKHQELLKALNEMRSKL